MVLCALLVASGQPVLAAAPNPRALEAATDFTIIGIPDTQNYAGELEGGQVGMLDAQTQWIRDNRTALNIVYVAHLGDCVEHANDVDEWEIFDDAMRTIEDPVQTGLPHGIAYGLAVGNHDQSPVGDPDGASTQLFNQYFGVSRFTGRSYYGGHYGSNNDNHYDLFSAGGENFIVVYLEFNDDADEADPEFGWAENLLRTHSTRRAIVVRHELITSGANWRSQGNETYEALKDNPNLFLMLCGHLTGEARRTDTFNGSSIHTVLSDYQSRTNGGDGYLRIYTFSPSVGQIRVQTYSPWLDRYETDTNSQFTLPYTPGGSQTTHTITASAGPDGTISPSGAVGVPNGGSQTFTITPALGSGVADVLVDGASVGPVPSYTFSNVTGNRSIHATFTSAPGTGDFVRFEQTASGTSVDLASVTTSTLTGAAGHLYVAAVSTKNFREPSALSGLGLTWTRVRSQCAARNQTGVVLYVAQGTPSGSGSVTATFSSAPRSATIVVNRYSGVATQTPVGAVVSGNTLGVSGSCSGGTDNGAYSLPLTTTTPGALVFGAASMRSVTHTPGAGYLERNEQRAPAIAGNASSIAVMDRTMGAASTVAVAGAFSQVVDWAVIGIEIRPGAVAATGPDIAVTPTSHSFGSVAVGTSSEQTFTVRNDGNANLSVGAPFFQGGDVAHFGIVGGTSAVVVSPGATHAVTVRFTPASSGNKSTTLRIPSDDTDENPVSVALSGSGVVQAPDIAVSPASFNYTGVVPPGSAQQTFQIGNTGNAALTITAIEVTGTQAAAFSVEAQSLPLTIAPSTSRSLAVTFSPSVAATHSATLRITCNDPDEGTVDVALSGDASGEAADIAFEEVESGSSLALTSVVTSAALTARSNHLYLAAVSCKPHRPASSVQGLGLSWSRLDTQCGGRNQTGIELWMASGVPAGDGVVTASFASAPSSAAIVVARYSGASAGLGSVISANSNGVNGGCADGTDRNTYSVPITTSVPSAVLFGAVALRNTAHAPGSGFTERVEMHTGGTGGSASGIALVDRSLTAAGNQNLSGTFAAALDWAAVAVEIRPAGAPTVLAGARPKDETTVAAGVPRQLTLAGVPNPFNPRTTLRFALPEARSVRLSILDVAGRRVRVLVDEMRDAGVHEITWAGTDASDRRVPSGIYVAVLEAGNASRTLKLLLAK